MSSSLTSAKSARRPRLIPRPLASSAWRSGEHVFAGEYVDLLDMGGFG